MGIADIAKEEAELWIPALCPVLGKARWGSAVEPLEWLQLTSAFHSQLLLARESVRAGSQGNQE